MSSVRHLVVSLSYGIGFWVLASFTGAMLDPARAEPWTTSLMWSLLAAALIAPALLMAYHHARSSKARAQKASRGADAGAPKSFIDEPPSIEETPSSADEPATQPATLWPEPERQETRPASEASEEWPAVREDARPTAA